MNKITLVTLLSLSLIIYAPHAAALSADASKLIATFINDIYYSQTDDTSDFIDRVSDELELFNDKGHLRDLLIRVKSEQGEAGQEKLKSFTLDATELPKDARENEVDLYKRIKDSHDRFKEVIKTIEQKQRPILREALENATQKPGFALSYASLQTAFKQPELSRALESISHKYMPDLENVANNFETIKGELFPQRSSFEEIIKEKEMMD